MLLPVNILHNIVVTFTIHLVTDKSSCFKPVVELSRHGQNLQHTAEVTCGYLINQAMMTSVRLNN